MTPVEVHKGDSPLILAMPHTGIFVPEGIRTRLNENGQALIDTDWHIDLLYEGLAQDATIVRATFHRYVIDANRDPTGASLYPGQNTTGLCPVTDFDGCAIYLEGGEPDADEIESRRTAFHAPYHTALQAEIDRVVDRHGVAVLYDCHSIRGRIPFLFDGQLPDFNIGTNSGATCASEIESMTADVCAAAQGYTSVTNGRFKGGWTTRYYGQPETGVHAIQMELAQDTYLQNESPPFAYSTSKADNLRPHLRQILGQLTAWAIETSLKGSRP